jgi:hypothetical protein
MLLKKLFLKIKVIKNCVKVVQLTFENTKKASDQMSWQTRVIAPTKKSPNKTKY